MMKQDVRCDQSGNYGTIVVVFLLGLGFQIPQAWAIECGDTLGGGKFKLTKNVTCDSNTTPVAVPAITLKSDSTLDLNGFAVLCNDAEDRKGIVLEGRKIKLQNGVISGCRNGIVVTGMEHRLKHLLVINNGRDGLVIDESDDNRVKYVHANFNGRTGFNIMRSNGNHVHGSSATNNGRQGFKIDGRADPDERMDAAKDNVIRNSTAYLNCRDGIEIDEGDDNSVIRSIAVSNGNQAACVAFGGSFRPQFYAGFDMTVGSNFNTLKNNKASGNQGCNIKPGESECIPRDRNLWDENADASGCISTNLWKNNRVDGVKVEPECSPGP
jgi:parallel beta helix pectate lyase-like protein